MAIQALVVDNNPVLLRAVSRILEQEGCVVRTAETGLAALELLEEQVPEIIFTDLVMPLVSGEQLCRIIRNTPRYETAYVVILSAIVLEDYQRIMEEIPCDLCIAKGSLSEIRTHLQQALRTFLQKREHRKEGGAEYRIPDGLKPSEVTEELLSAQRHLTSILTNLDEGIVELSGDGHVVRTNGAALEILDLREEQLIGKNLLEVVSFGTHSGQIEDWLHGGLFAGVERHLEILETNPLVLNDKRVTASFTVASESEGVFGLCIFRDITRQYLAEENSRQFDEAFRFVRKMDALSSMAGGVAHDFNNLLSIICGNLELSLQKDPNIVREQKELDHHVRSAFRTAQVAVDLTRQISCFSNFGIVTREPLDIEGLVRSVADRFMDSHDIAMDFHQRCQRCAVNADRSEIQQVVENVLKNSVEAGANSVRISIDRYVLESPMLKKGRYLLAGDYVRICIEDNGRGIPPEKISSVFDPYFSTKERGAIKGMGLGLALVYAVMRSHAGHAIVESEQGTGTLVTLLMPLLSESEQPDEPVGNEVSVSPRILLLDRDEHMGTIGKVMLSHLGYDPVVVQSEEALHEFLGSPDSGIIDCGILDVAGMEKTDVVRLCERVREVQKDCALVAMSGTPFDPAMVDCLGCGFVNGISKPYTLEILEQVISQATKGRKG